MSMFTSRIQSITNICKAECVGFYENPSCKNLGSRNDKDTCASCMYWYSISILPSCGNGNIDNCCSCGDVAHMFNEYNYCEVAQCLRKGLNKPYNKQEGGCGSSLFSHFNTSNTNSIDSIINKVCPTSNSCLSSSEL